MVYAIIDAVSDIEELITVAYAEKPYGLAEWFIEEVRDSADMYLSAEEDFALLDKSIEALAILANEDASDLDDIDGITVEVSDISVSVIGAYHTYEDMKAGLCAFLSEKPKFKKLVVPDNPYETQTVLDSLNRSLIKCGI